MSDLVRREDVERILVQCARGFKDTAKGRLQKGAIAGATLQVMALPEAPDALEGKTCATCAYYGDFGGCEWPGYVIDDPYYKPSVPPDHYCAAWRERA